MPLTKLFAWVVGLGASGAYGAYTGGAYGGGAYAGTSTGAAAYAGLVACVYPGLAVCALRANAGAAVGTSGALREDDDGGSGRAVLGALCVRCVNICFHRRGVGGCEAIRSTQKVRQRGVKDTRLREMSLSVPLTFLTFDFSRTIYRVDERRKENPCRVARSVESPVQTLRRLSQSRQSKSRE
jgi:hypothetical protein